MLWSPQEIACVASVSVGFQSKERPKNEILIILPRKKWERVKNGARGEGGRNYGTRSHFLRGKIIKTFSALKTHRNACYAGYTGNYGGPQVSRHNLLCHSTTYFLTAQLTFSRHNLLSSRHSLLSHGTTYFFRGTIYFLTAKITFFLQILLFYLSRHNLLSHGGSKFSWRKFNGFLCQREVCRFVGYLQLIGPQSLGSIIVVRLCVLLLI